MTKPWSPCKLHFKPGNTGATFTKLYWEPELITLLKSNWFRAHLSCDHAKIDQNTLTLHCIILNNNKSFL